MKFDYRCVWIIRNMKGLILTLLLSALSESPTPALLVGNGINRFRGNGRSSWDDLLQNLAREQNVEFTPAQRLEMSNTEFYDILDLSDPGDARIKLQRSVRDLMKTWSPAMHHESIVRWASYHDTPIVTVNFDLNLSRFDGMKLFHQPFQSAVYPWSSYYAWQEIESPHSGFGIFHPHGMIKYPGSIRLGLRHYLRSIAKIQEAIFENGSLWKLATGKQGAWNWHFSWFQPIFFKPLVILGFQLAKDETLMRWLLLERARLHRAVPSVARNTYYVGLRGKDLDNRKPYFKELGIEVIEVVSYEDIYGEHIWG